MSSSRENRVKSPSKCLAPARSPIVPTIFGIPASLGVVPTQSQVPPLAGGEARLGWAVMVERWLSTTDWTLHLQIYSSCQSFWFSIQQHSMKELERETHVCVHAHRPHTRTQAPHTRTCTCSQRKFPHQTKTVFSEFTLLSDYFHQASYSFWFISIHKQTNASLCFYCSSRIGFLLEENNVSATTTLPTADLH